MTAFVEHVVYRQTRWLPMYTTVPNDSNFHCTCWISSYYMLHYYFLRVRQNLGERTLYYKFYFFILSSSLRHPRYIVHVILKTLTLLAPFFYKLSSLRHLPRFLPSRTHWCAANVQLNTKGKF